MEQINMPQILDEIGMPIYVNGLDRDIITTLQMHGPLTRGELVIILGVPRTTLFDHLEVLKKRLLVKSFVRPRSSRGRPPVFYKIV